MADRRLIAQSITDSGQVARLIRRCGPWAGIFFSWCIPFIDDDSRLDGDPETLHSIVLGRYVDEVSDADVAEFVATMNDLELAVWYEVIDSDERYLHFPKFQVQQGLRADRYVPSRRPAPPGWVADEGHPYSKHPDLVKSKPPKDRRRTHRVPKRKPIAATVTTTPPPSDNQSAPDGRPVVAKPQPDDAISVLSGPSSLVLSNPSSLVAEPEVPDRAPEDDPFPEDADLSIRGGPRGAGLSHAGEAAARVLKAAQARAL